MKKFNLLHPLILSFYSKSLYQDVARNWRGKAFLYLLILLAIVWLPNAAQMYLHINHAMDTEVPKIIKQVPKITIQEGQVTVNENMPYLIYDPMSKAPLVVIDTTGKMSTLNQTNAQTLLTKNKLYIRKSTNEVREYDLSNVKNFVVTQEKLYDYSSIIKKWGALVIYPFLVVGSYLYRIIQALIYAAIGALIFNKIIKSDLDYQKILQLTLVAITPAIIIGTILSFFIITFRFELWFYFALSMVYLYLAIKANAVQTS